MVRSQYHGQCQQWSCEVHSESCCNYTVCVSGHMLPFNDGIDKLQIIVMPVKQCTFQHFGNMNSFPPWFMTCLAAAVGAPLPQDAAGNQPSPCGNLMMFERTFLYCLMNMVPLVELHTLSQTNMQMDKGALEDKLFVGMVDFPLPCFLVNVYIHHYNPS